MRGKSERVYTNKVKEERKNEKKNSTVVVCELIISQMVNLPLKFSTLSADELSRRPTVIQLDAQESSSRHSAIAKVSVQRVALFV